MNRWSIPVAIVLVVNGFILLPAMRERHHPSSEAIVSTCSGDLRGGDQDDATVLMLPLADRSLPAVAHPSDGQLRALGFTADEISALHPVGSDAVRWPVQRPVWIRLRADTAPPHRLVIAEVRRSRDELGLDRASVILRALVRVAPTPRRLPGEGPGPTESGFDLSVAEYLPGQLSLSRSQEAAIRAARGGEHCLGSSRQVHLQNDRLGLLWVGAVE